MYAHNYYMNTKWNEKGRKFLLLIKRKISYPRTAYKNTVSNN